MSGYRMRTTRIVNGQVRSARYSEGEPVEESRQEYATRRVQEYQLACANDQPPLSFEDLRSTFVFAGREFDAGRKVAA